jgi:hypothetical protein
MKPFVYPSESMQRQLEQAKAYLRERRKYIIDTDTTWTPSPTVRWEEYKKLAQQNHK